MPVLPSRPNRQRTVGVGLSLPARMVAGTFVSPFVNVTRGLTHITWEHVTHTPAYKSDWESVYKLNLSLGICPTNYVTT